MISTALILFAFSPQETKPDLSKDSWGKFKPGSWIKVRTVTKREGRQLSSSDYTETLESVSEKAVVRVRESGGKKERSESWPSLNAALDEGKLKDHKEVGAEDVKVDDVTYHCKIFEQRATFGGEESVYRKWVTDKYPGGIVKREDRDPGLFQTSRLVKTKESLKIGWKDVSCQVWESTVDSDARGKSVHTAWFSDDVPGSRVKSIEVTGKVEIVEELVDFEVK